MAIAANSVSAADIDVKTVEIPDYMVTNREGLDYVDLPGGEILMTEEGRPRVPYWVQTWDYPAGVRVQHVLMQERTGRITVAGLQLPVVILQDDPEVPVAMKSGWYPQEIFKWQILDNANNTTTLAVSIFPFYYDPDTLDAAFYRQYVFSIEKTATPVQITGVATDRELYPAGSKVTLTLSLHNAAQPLDVVAQADVRDADTGESVGNLPMQVLQSLGGDAACSFIWDTGGMPAGDYRADMVVTDASGNIQDKAAIDLLIREARDIPKTAAAAEGGKISIWIVIILGVGALAALILLAVWIRRRRYAR
ncbi:MAG TPA: hypothetical protein DD727_01605 [Clostridiales bacterium]|nr:hypothetical protein [Clostridiales bacterium]